MPPLSLQEDFPETKERRAVSSKALPPHGFFDLFTVQVERIPLPPDCSAKASYNLRHILHIGNLRAAFQHDLLFCQNRRRDQGRTAFWNPGLLPFRKAAFRRESDILPPVLSHPASLFTVCITLPFCSRSARFFRLLIGVPRDQAGKPTSPSRTTRGAPY